MNLKTEERLVSYGCLVVLIGFLTCFYLAYRLHWLYAIAAFGLIGIGQLLMSLHDKCVYREQMEILKHAFAESKLPLPDFQYLPQYGFPSYTLTFPTEADLKQAEAEGCIAAFKQKIQELYRNTGPKNNPFNVEQAVWCTYVGWQFPPDAFHFGKPNDLP